jgi:hypothetical protein
MKKIIEQMVRQEIKDILAKDEDTIREIVKTSLLPELRAAVRASISRELEDLINETPEIVNAPKVAEDVLSQVKKQAQKSESDSKKDLSPRTSDLGPRDSDLEHGKISSESNTSGRYLYCIVEGSEGVNFGKIGIEGNEVYTIPYNDLCAVVHDCPAEPYQSEDKEVVKRWVVAHQKVIDSAWERYGTALPMGFDTIIRGNEVSDPGENMRNWLREDYKNLKGKIEKVRTRAEYVVQIFWDSKVMSQRIIQESSEINKLKEEIKSKPRGLAYMYRQKLEDALRKEMEKQANRYFKEFYDRVKPYLDVLHVEKTKKTVDENKQMLMNLSCLLPKCGSERLGDELEKIDSMEGFSVRYTGPWPPYSFV